MRSPSTLVRLILVLGLSILGCSKKEEAPGPLSAKWAVPDLDCSLAPSQSKVVAGLASAGGSAAATTAAVGQALGLSVLPHSSGALTLSGSGGYIAGTIGTAIVVPTIIYVGVVVGGVAAAVELICFPKNYPDSKTKLDAVASELALRTKDLSSQTVAASMPIVAKLKASTLHTGSEAVEFASRASIEFAEAIRNAAS